VGYDIFGIGAYETGPIVLVGNAVGNGGMQLFHESCRQAPGRVLRGFPGNAVGRFENTGSYLQKTPK
jgi:hypothetical protein